MTLPSRLLAELDVLLSAVPADIYSTPWVRDACAAMREAAAALSGREAVAQVNVSADSTDLCWIDNEAKWAFAGRIGTHLLFTTPQGDGVVVPREPTEAQRNSIYMALHYDMNVQTPDEWGAVDKAYAAMIAAAPSAKGVAS